jgi:hypothetical protein
VKLLVTTVAVGIAALTLSACSHETALKETPQQIAQEQSAADAHNRDTVPSPGDDETPSTDEPVSSPPTSLLEYEQLDSLRVGDCVDLPSPQTASVRPIGCDMPHNAEVTARIDVASRFPNGAPSQVDYDHMLVTDCKRAFDDYVRQPPPDDVQPGEFNPSAESWYTGFHFLICTADAKRDGNVLTGSVRKPG